MGRIYTGLPPTSHTLFWGKFLLIPLQVSER
jgi:hypothetical protein